jgi:hypothetical protein
MQSDRMAAMRSPLFLHCHADQREAGNKHCDGGECCDIADHISHLALLCSYVSILFRSCSIVNRILFRSSDRGQPEESMIKFVLTIALALASSTAMAEQIDPALIIRAATGD